MNGNESNRLESWKQIAAYLGRSERTVRRWQQNEGLPVHKHQHLSRGSVWAYTDEVDEWLKSRQVSPPEEGAAEGKAKSTPWLAGSGVALLAVLGIAAFAFRSPSSIVWLEPESLTAYPGSAYGAALSPDGRQLAFFWTGEGRQGIYRKAIHDAEPVPVALGGFDKGFVYNPAWSPDGKTIAFLRRTSPKGSSWAANSQTSETWLCFVDVEPSGFEDCRTRIAQGAPLFANFQHLSWDAAGERVIAPMALQGKANGIFWIRRDGQKVERLTESTSQDFAPVLAPDFRSFAFIRSEGPTYAPVQVVLRQELRADGSLLGPPRELARQRMNLSGMAWLPSGRELLLCKSDRSFLGPLNSRLFRLRWDGVEVLEQAAIDTCSNLAAWHGETGVIHLLYSTGNRMSSQIWKAPMQDLSRAQAILPSTRLDAAPEFSPDGSRVAFLSSRSGEVAVWLAQADGRGLRQLTRGLTVLSRPRWSSDGKRLVYAIAADVQQASQSRLVSYEVDTGRQMMLPLPGGVQPSDPWWESDGQRLFFFDGEDWLWSAGPGAEEPRRLKAFPGRWLSGVSAGGSVYLIQRANPFRLVRWQMRSGEERMIADDLSAPFLSQSRQFVYYLQSFEMRLMRLPFASADEAPMISAPIAGLRRQHVVGLAVSPNNEQVYWAVADPQRLDLARIRGKLRQ